MSVQPSSATAESGGTAPAVRLSGTSTDERRQPLGVELAAGDLVLSVTPGYGSNVVLCEKTGVAPERSSGLIRRLLDAVRTQRADIAIASPFAKGGRLRGPWWLSRFVISSENGFLSLAAHGELTCVIGTVRLIRSDVLARVVKTCRGNDLASEIVLEARKQGFRIVEVPADLTYMPPLRPFTVRAVLDTVQRSWNRLRIGLRFRPALWLGLPGLIPGLLPLVVGLLLLLRVTPAQAAFWTVVTLVVQYGSLAILSWQTTTFVARRLARRHPK